MKNIKVNIINTNGVRSSTTINYVMALYLYRSRSSSEERANKIQLGDEFLNAAITDCLQFFVNSYVLERQNLGLKGVSQRGIEEEIMEVLFAIPF